MPSFLANRTSRSRARFNSLASVGNITAFGCTVVSITTRERSDGFMASVLVATARLSCSSAFPHPLAPPRQRRALERQIVPEELLPAEVLEVRVLHPALAQNLVGQIVGVLEQGQPRHQPGRQRRLARLVAIDRPELLLQETPVDRPRQLHQRVLHVDDLVKPRAEQILLATLPPLAWPHRQSPAPSPRARRITACDS